jgi:Cof subfamily protein (haloacid dehalogenase superfamily)
LSELPYRLCAIDLDETLLGPDHLISARNAQAVQAIVKQGVIVLLASGRMHASTLRFAEQLELETPIISYNGALVKNPRTGDVWLEEQISPNAAAILLDYCRENDLQLNYYLHDTLYTAAYTPWLKLYYDRTLSPVKVLPDFYAALRDTAPTKLIIVDSPQRTNGLLVTFRERFGTQLYITKSNDEYLEFMPPTANKGRALALVAQRFDIPAAETLAFGDSYNDIPMLRWAGRSMAMQNAKAEVLAAADCVVLSNAEDGVGVALEEIFGLDKTGTNRS